MIDVNETLHYSYERNIENAYIISLKNNEISERLTQRCIKSCDNVGRSYKIWEAFDGTTGKIITPEHLKDKHHFGWLKIINTGLTPTQVACFFSHYSLWCHCIEIDKPIIILEHDAIMVQNFEFYNAYGIIIYLGSLEQMQGAPVYNIPPHATDYEGHMRTICRAHAYAIDPISAKNLVSHVIKYGIYESLDMYMRADLFTIFQYDLYAYDDPNNESTIHKDWKTENHWRKEK